MTKKWLSITGTLHCQPDGTALPFGKYVYQKTRKGNGNIPGDKTRSQQVRRWVHGTVTRTPKQVNNRASFKLGVEKWQGMSETEKEAWREKSTERGLNRFQGFMSNWMKAID